MGEELIYRIRPSNSLSHAYSSPYQKSTYDPAKRHDRYERSKKLVGRKARTTNPYGNYASPYYDPNYRHEYYEKHKQLKLIGSSSKKFDSDAGSSGGSSGRGSGAGSNGAKAALANRIKQLRDASRFETKAQREAAKMQINDLKKQLNKQLNKLNKERAQNTKLGQEERLTLRERAEADIEKARKQRESDVKGDTEQLKEKKEAQLDPVRKENAKIRGRLDSMGKASDAKERARLKRELARNNEEISGVMADYTDSLTNMKTKHALTMRNNISKIRGDLRNDVASSSVEQRTKNAEISNRIKQARMDNKTEIARVRAELNKWVSAEKERLEANISRLTGKANKAKADKKEAARVKKRAKQIYREKTGKK